LSSSSSSSVTQSPQDAALLETEAKNLAAEAIDLVAQADNLRANESGQAAKIVPDGEEKSELLKKAADASHGAARAFSDDGNYTRYTRARDVFLKAKNLYTQAGTKHMEAARLLRLAAKIVPDGEEKSRLLERKANYYHMAGDAFFLAGNDVQASGNYTSAVFLYSLLSDRATNTEQKLRLTKLEEDTKEKSRLIYSNYMDQWRR
jgi:hypothetical protein